jgi:LysR family transcriptional regulator, glycine cleavage system transcriptional activator
MIKDTEFPPLGPVRIFAVAARYENFKRAAKELGVTPTAVSAQIKSLETFLGCPLFERGAQSVRLNEAGRQFADACHTIFARLNRAVLEVKQVASRESITIKVGPGFGSQWLSKRLTSFWQRFPETGLHLQYSPGAVEFSDGLTDLMVAWGDGDWPGLQSEPLLDFNVAPVVGVPLKQAYNMPALPADLLKLPLLHWKDHSGWQEWFDAMNVKMDPYLPGVVIEDANTVLQAAQSGQGVALGILPLIESELDSGQLFRLFDENFSPSRSYHLVHPDGAMENAHLKAFRDWIVDEAR